MNVISPADFSHVTPLGRGVEKGEVVDVDDELGSQLVAQGWRAQGGPVKRGGKATLGDVGPETVAPAASDKE